MIADSIHVEEKAGQPDFILSVTQRHALTLQKQFNDPDRRPIVFGQACCPWPCARSAA